MVYRGASEVKFFIRLHTFVWFVPRLVNIFRRDGVQHPEVFPHRRYKRHEESQNVVRITCRKVRQREYISIVAYTLPLQYNYVIIPI